ncbi:hypothetical protein EK904_007190 [Melospiza melodia maxima]|nr:hypothetical protein EK904_007190 [Melospiza melodia maxima]
MIKGNSFIILLVHTPSTRDELSNLKKRLLAKRCSKNPKDQNEVKKRIAEVQKEGSLFHPKSTKSNSLCHRESTQRCWDRAVTDEGDLSPLIAVCGSRPPRITSDPRTS